MAATEKPRKQPLLSDGLTETERLNLISLTQHPGFPVLEKMHMTACTNANEAVIALDQTEEGFERKFKPLQQRARDFSEFSILILGSISWHEEYQEHLDAEAKQQVEPPAQNPILSKGIKKANE